MSSEEDLPGKLENLNIAPHQLEQAKLESSDNSDWKLPLAQNPFYDDTIKHIRIKDSADLSQTMPTTFARVPNCRRCRMRRRSESVLDDFKVATSNASTDAAELATVRCTPGVYRQPLKKTTSRVIMREPVLQALRSCLHSENYVRRKLLLSSAVPDPSAPVAAQKKSALGDSIFDCNNSLEHEVDFGKGLRNLNLSRHRSPNNFTTMQKTACRKAFPHVHSNSEGDKFPLTSITPSTPFAPAAQSEPNTTQRGSTSCAQQAGNGATGACDDVTIDELASYFDTLVHIPKKMSSMAEMMYI